jgi:hypothetical protein
MNQVLVGGLVSTINVVVHALIMALVVKVAHAAAARHPAQSYLRLTLVMIETVFVLKIAHATEVLVWAFAYWLVDAAPAGANLVYFAFVNYTTLGYGDVIPVPEWNLLGPMTAMNGILLFGWSTAVIFEVLRKTMNR